MTTPKLQPTASPAIAVAGDGETKRSTTTTVTSPTAIATGVRVDAPDRMFEDSSMQYKVILLGDGGTGKTSLVSGFCSDNFARTYAPTLGAECVVRRVPLPAAAGGGVTNLPISPVSNAHPLDVSVGAAGDSNHENTSTSAGISLAIWDVGGHRIGSRMITNYIHAAHAVLLCYDITNAQSFQNLEDWLLLVRRTFAVTSPNHQPYIALVANKMDLQHLRTVRADRHQAFHEANHLQGSFFVSAKSAAGVRFSLNSIAVSLAKPLLPAVDAAALAGERLGTNNDDNDNDAPPYNTTTGTGGGTGISAGKRGSKRVSVSPRRLHVSNTNEQSKCLIM